MHVNDKPCKDCMLCSVHCEIMQDKNEDEIMKSVKARSQDLIDQIASNCKDGKVTTLSFNLTKEGVTNVTVSRQGEILVNIHAPEMYFCKDYVRYMYVKYIVGAVEQSCKKAAKDVEVREKLIFRI